VAVDKRRINREIRRQRKEAEAAAAQAAETVGMDDGGLSEFDAEERRRRMEASFYNKATKADKRSGGGRRKNYLGSTEEDYEYEAGWQGGSTKKEGKKKSKKVKTVVPTYNTAEELTEALRDLLLHVPPTALGSGMTLAALGDKLQTLTKHAWNKRYKTEFGSMKQFLQRHKDLFVVEGEEVRLVELSGGKSKPRNKSNSASSADKRKNKRSNASNRTRSGDDEDDDEDEDEIASDYEEEDDDDEDSSSSRGGRRKKKDSGGVCSLSTMFASLVLAGTGAAIYFLSQQQPKQ